MSQFNGQEPDQYPYVSIIIPCRNEARYIRTCMDSILANDYPRERREILLVDGMSHDGTREIIQEYVEHDPRIKMIDNPHRITPIALNMGIAQSQGDIVMRMDAHASYKYDYISNCVEGLSRHHAENIGGIWVTIPRNNSFIGNAIVRSLSHFFGVGSSHYRLAKSTQPKAVDAVPFFCCRRELFRSIGLFNEDLKRGQDMEFNLRLRKHGGKTILHPNIISYYYARSDLVSFIRHNWNNGVWAILPFAYSQVMPVSWRHLVPLFFVLSLSFTGILGLTFHPFMILFWVISSSYILASSFASFHIAMREKDLRYLIGMPIIFWILHFGYGLGSLWGIFRLIFLPRFWKRVIGYDIVPSVYKT